MIKTKDYNKRGVAILLVLSTTALLSYLLADFTYKTQINQIKSANIQDITQAKLNAEAGLNFAFAKLRIYQEALNLREKNSSLKKTLPESTLQSLVTQPMVYPVPVTKDSLIQKNFAQEFNKKNILDGQMNVSISPSSGFINVNSLAMNTFLQSSNNHSSSSQSQFQSQFQTQSQSASTSGLSSSSSKAAKNFIRNKLISEIDSLLKTKSEELGGVAFEAKYGNVDAKSLVNELQFFVSSQIDITNYSGDINFAEASALYLDKGIEPKHHPLTSKKELYLLQGWNDNIIDLIKPLITVHQTNVIEVNKITNKQLKFLFPNITKDQLSQFFKYRDGDTELKTKKHSFKNAEDFKQAIIRFQISSEQKFKTLEDMLSANKLSFGTSSNYYQVVSVGIYNDAHITLKAQIEIPRLEKIKIKPPNKKRPPPEIIYLKPRILEIL